MVDIDPRIWEAWRDRSAESTKALIQMQYTSDQSPAADARRVRSVVKRVVAAFHATQEALPEGTDPVSAGDWSVDKTGDSVLITASNKCDAFEELLREMVSRLERNKEVGTGRLALHFAPEPPRIPGLAAIVAARMRVNGQPPDAVPWHWRPDTAALSRVVKAAVTWSLMLCPDLAITVEHLGQPARIITRSEDPETMMDELVAGNVPWPTLTCIARDRYRCVVVSPSDGRVTVIQGGAAFSQDGTGSAGTLRELMTSVAHELVYAYIKRDHWFSETQLDNLGEKGNGPYPRLADGHRASLSEDRLAPDVFAIQLLGPGYRERVPQLPHWRLTPLSGDRTLLEHQHLDAWFAPLTIAQAFTGQTQPPLPLIEAARRDLADILYQGTPADPRRAPETGARA